MERELSEEIKNDLVEFQQLQQQIQLLQLQRQQMLAQIAEIDKAREEVEKTPNANNRQLYRFVGSIIIPKKKEELLKELTEERESLDVRVNAFKKQEDKLRERYDALRKKLEQKLSETQQPTQSQSMQGPQLHLKTRGRAVGEGAIVA